MILNRMSRPAWVALAVGTALACPPALAQAPATTAAAVPAPPAAATTAEAMELRAALPGELSGAGEPDRAAIGAFYEARGFAPFWTAPDTDRLAVLVATTALAPAHGLPADRYEPGALAAALAGGTPAAREALAARIYLRWATDVSAGLLTPARIDPEINVSVDRPAPGALLARLDAEPLAEVLSGLEPATPEYRALMAEKAALEALAGSGAWGAPVPDGPSLHPGESGAQVPALRARLARLGYPAPPTDDKSSTTYDVQLEAAVQRFQSDHGLMDDGVLGRRTLRAINVTPEGRWQQVVVNLERLRWAARDPGPRYIAVNIPDYSVTMYDHGAEAYHTRAVVGVASETETPEFSDVMTHMVVNPTWHIPDSIATRVYLPKLRSDPSVLARSNMSLFTRSGVQINPRLVDFSHYSASSFPFRIKQNPSSANALGRVKFMFPNRFSIYLHDTPARDLFARDGRAFSNGCVRLEEPIELAHILLQDQVADPAAAFDAWLATGSERYVNLEEPVPVHILYRTVWAKDGTVHYRHDVYGRDAKVYRALAAEGVSAATAQG